VITRIVPPGLVIAALAAFSASTTRPSSADPLPDGAQGVADYDIRVRLDAEEKRLTGEERVVWRNPSQDTVAELRFHLYLNAFRNSKSTFFRESGGRPRRSGSLDGGWGGIDITSIRRADGRDLEGATSFEHPDDGNSDDRTVLRVVLPDPVPPGGSVALDLGFEARLPGAFVRTGFVRDYFLVAQWFPKVGVYEPAGRRGRETGGWSCHTFHAEAEFYADFGHYHVEITVPSRFVVGATGRRVDQRNNGDGTTTHVYEQGNVHDFAWTADPRFLEVRRRFVADEQVTPAEYEETARLLGRSLEEVRLTDVEILVLLQPSHAPQRERHVRAAMAALKWYGLWYGRYPHETLTVVDPAPGGGGSVGMEYPTFITAGTLFLANRWPFDGVLMPEEVILHEFGHQYWQGMVASHEAEEAWLDEGFTTWSTAKVAAREYGPDRIRVGDLRLGRFESLRIPNRSGRDFAPIRSPAWNVSRDFRFDVYTRTALTLQTLEGLIGEEAMARVMRTYHERWRFRHPTSEDFYAVASEVSGRDLDSFFAETVEGAGFLDYEVVSARTEPERPPEGILEDGADALRAFSEASDSEAEPDAEAPQAWRSEVRVRRRGELVLPVELELQFADGPPVRRRWDGRDRWARFEVRGAHPLVAAVADPDDRLALDVNRLNNAVRVDPDGSVAAWWGARLTFWLQLMLGLGGL
jgi:hypothetical protein